MIDYKWRHSDTLTIVSALISSGILITMINWVSGAAKRNADVENVIAAVNDKDTGLGKLNSRVTRLEDQHEDEEAWLRGIAEAVGARQIRVKH